MNTYSVRTIIDTIVSAENEESARQFAKGMENFVAITDCKLLAKEEDKKIWTQENLEAMSNLELQALRLTAMNIIEERREKEKEKAILNFKIAIDNFIKEYPDFINKDDIIEIINGGQL